MADILDDKLAATSGLDTKQALIGRPYGGKSIRYITGTTPVAGLNVFWITFLTDTVFTTLTAVPNFTVHASLIGPTFPAGTQIGVRVSAITLASGSILINEL
jgi:hypothetical protein